MDVPYSNGRRRLLQSLPGALAAASVTAAVPYLQRAAAARVTDPVATRFLTGAQREQLHFAFDLAQDHVLHCMDNGDIQHDLPAFAHELNEATGPLQALLRALAAEIRAAMPAEQYATEPADQAVLAEARRLVGAHLTQVFAAEWEPVHH